MPVPESFRTARLQAERLAPHHLRDLIRFHRDPAVMAELGGVRDGDQTAQYLSRNLDHWVKHGFGVWILREIDGSEVVGRALLRYLPVGDVNEVEIGYALYPRLWGRGLATEIAEAAMALARSKLDAESLVGVTTPANRASQRVLAKLGFHYERELLVEGTMCSLYRVSWPTSTGDGQVGLVA